MPIPTDPSPALADLLTRLDRLAGDALALWGAPADAALRLLNVSENVTYLVEAPTGCRAVLRVHRDGYHSRAAIASELAWMDALDAAGAIRTPRCIPGVNGDQIQSVRDPETGADRFLTLFQFIDGAAPDESKDLAPGFETLGVMAARCHDHALTWRRPPGFQRMHWDDAAVFGPAAHWGDWRAAPHVDAANRPLLERVEAVVTRRLAAFGKAPDRYTLIHADMRLANLLAEGDDIRLIDFDDCGFGWLLYDFAAAVSFIEDDPRIPDLKAAWLTGYRSVRPLAAADVAEMDTFVMLRRMALLAWIGSHIDAPEPQALAPDFASVTAELGAAYLDRFAD